MPLQVAKQRVTASGNVRTDSGVLLRIIVEAPGTAGNLTVWDGNAVADEIDANRIFLKGFGAMAAGEVIQLGVPVSTGIRVAVTTGGVFLFVHARNF